MRSHTYFMRTVASLLTVTMSVLQIDSYAGGSQDSGISAAGREAQVFGQSFSNSFKSNMGTVQNGTISMPTLKNGQFQMDGGSQVNVNDLYPGTSSSNKEPESYYFPDANKPDVEGLQNIYDSDNDMDSVGNNAKGSLWSDAQLDNPSISGAAYKVLLDASNSSRPDFSNDPMLDLSKKTYENIDLIAEEFGDCTAETTLNQDTFNAHVPDYVRCERVIKPSGACDIIHSIEISSTLETVYVASQGRTWLTVQFDLKNGSWQAISPSDGARKVAQIPTVDYNAICGGALNYKTDLIGSWDWLEHGLPGKVDSTVVYRVKQYPTCNNELVGIVQIQDTKVSSSIDWINGGKFQFRFTRQEEEKWSPQSCIEDALKLQDGFCTGSMSIVAGAQNESDCITVNGERICPGQSFYNSLQPSPLQGIPRLAQKVRLSELQCDFNVGQMECWTDPQGIEHCPLNDGSNLNSCAELESNPQCGFVSSKCVDGAEGISGACYVHEDTFDCGTDVSVPTLEKETEYQCGGPISCMGDECLDIATTQSTDFARATALLNAAQFLTQDMSCTDSATSEGGDANVEIGCTVFGGEPGECKIAVGGVSDCCEKPDNISMADYLTLLMSVPKLDGAILALAETNPSAVTGAYQALREPVMSAWTEVTEPFASYIENVSGTYDQIVTPIEEFVDQIIEELKEEVKKLLRDVMGTGGEGAATDEAVGAGVEKGGETLVEDSAAASFLSTVMMVYTIYVVAVLLIQIIYACEEEEFTLNAKRALNSCTHVGSYCKSEVLGACIEKREAYCCFNSPLSRIIQEQVRQQLGISFGDSKDPQCGGIPLEQIALIDWSKINLDEWLGILQQNGHFPDPNSLNLDSLTGSGNVFNMDGTRKNAQERTLERLEGIDVDEKRREATNNLAPQTGAPTSGGG